MASGSLGSLTVDLAANITRFEKSLNRAEQLAEKRSRAIKRSFTRLATGIGGALASYGFVNAVNGALEFADAIGKAADRAGIGTKKLQELRFAADQFGISTQQLDDGMRRFTRRLGVALDGGSFAKDFANLGVAIRDVNGNVRSSEDIFDDVSLAMGRLGSAAEKSKVAAQLFGDDAGPQLALLLGQGKGAIDALASEAQRLGIILGEDLIRNSERANDELSKIAQIAKIGATQAFASLAPEIEATAKAMQAITTGDAANMPDWLKEVALFATVAAKEFQDLGDWAGAVGAILAKVFAFEFDGIQTIIDARTEKRATLDADIAAYKEYLATVGQTPDVVAGISAKPVGDDAGTGEEVNIFTGLTDAQMETQLQQAIDMEERLNMAFEKSAKSRTDLEQRHSDAVLSARMNAVQQGVALLQIFAGKSKGAALASIALSKGLMIAQTVMSTQAASMRALAELGPIAGAPVAAAIQTAGAVSVALIAAQGLAQASQVGGGGANIGSVTNPISTSQVNTFEPSGALPQATTSGTITINVTGVVTDEIVNDLIVPAIQDAVNDKDVVLFNSDSRQALELS